MSFSGLRIEDAVGRLRTTLTPSEVLELRGLLRANMHCTDVATREGSAAALLSADRPSGAYFRRRLGRETAFPPHHQSTRGSCPRITQPARRCRPSSATRTGPSVPGSTPPRRHGPLMLGPAGTEPERISEPGRASRPSHAQGAWVTAHGGDGEAALQELLAPLRPQRARCPPARARDRSCTRRAAGRGVPASAHGSRLAARAAARASATKMRPPRERGRTWGSARRPRRGRAREPLDRDCRDELPAAAEAAGPLTPSTRG